jgi:hypothetical protein
MSLEALVEAEKEKLAVEKAMERERAKPSSRAAVASRMRRASRAQNKAMSGLASLPGGISFMDTSVPRMSNANALSSPSDLAFLDSLPPAPVVSDTMPTVVMNAMHASLIHKRGRVRKNSMSAAADIAASVFEAGPVQAVSASDRMVAPPPPSLPAN